MDSEIRQFYLDVIDIANTFPNIGWETKRLVFENVLNKIEKQADATIRDQVGNDIHVDTLILGDSEDSKDAEELSKN